MHEAAPIRRMYVMLGMCSYIIVAVNERIQEQTMNIELEGYTRLFGSYSCMHCTVLNGNLLRAESID